MKTEFCWLLPFANRVFEIIKIYHTHLKKITGASNSLVPLSFRD
jgi:hypothetical protein